MRPENEKDQCQCPFRTGKFRTVFDTSYFRQRISDDLTDNQRCFQVESSKGVERFVGGCSKGFTKRLHAEISGKGRDNCVTSKERVGCGGKISSQIWCTTGQPVSSSNEHPWYQVIILYMISSIDIRVTPVCGESSMERQ